jgi:hypothetical protein
MNKFYAVLLSATAFIAFQATATDNLKSHATHNNRTDALEVRSDVFFN